MHVTRQGANDAMTLESIQAMIDRAIQRNSTHTQEDASQNSGGGHRRPVQPARVYSYTGFMKCQPLNFRVTEGHDDAYAMTWETFKKRLTEKYCPKGEIKKLEIELWNLKVKGNDVGGHYKSDCSVLKNQGTEAQGMAYALGGGETNQDLDNMEDDINT
uniref:Reverse transcriptase domain-containing protein n=1 Tax=Tanacetum cinerariifolium TaxID=118510 RepID=A0A6L2LD60_TANCI|nr:reverse transcriptase domain-containing protein [Tanacetum cinerariifolium]